MHHVTCNLFGDELCFVVKPQVAPHVPTKNRIGYIYIYTTGHIQKSTGLQILLLLSYSHNLGSWEMLVHAVFMNLLYCT